MIFLSLIFSGVQDTSRPPRMLPTSPWLQLSQDLAQVLQGAFQGAIINSLPIFIPKSTQWEVVVFCYLSVAVISNHPNVGVPHGEGLLRAATQCGASFSSLYYIEPKKPVHSSYSVNRGWILRGEVPKGLKYYYQLSKVQYLNDGDNIFLPTFYALSFLDTSNIFYR